MNIILIVIDTLRYDYIGANGNDWIETPNLDRLASQSWCFDRCFTGSYPTIPHRTDVMTGQYGAPFHAWRPLPHSACPLPWLLAGNGYATQLIHDTPHLVNGGHNFDWPFHAWTFVRGAEVDRPWITDDRPWPENWGRDPLFDVLGPDTGLDERTVVTYGRANRTRKELDDWNCARLFDTAADFLRDNVKRENFFLWLDCFDPHEPWDAPPEFVLKYDKTDGYDGRVDPRTFPHRNDERLSEAARSRIKAYYAAKVTWVDHCLGKLMAALEETGLADNTLLLLTSDHGTNVGENGHFGKSLPARQREARVPLLIRTPEADSGRSDMLVQPQDIFATLLAAGGVALPAELDAQDVLSAARSGECGFRQIALCGQPVIRDTESTLFTTYTKDWELEVRADPQQSLLRRIGDYVEHDNPEMRDSLHWQAISEYARRGADPALAAWLKRAGKGPNPVPQLREAIDGYYPYFGRIYRG